MKKITAILLAIITVFTLIPAGSFTFTADAASFPAETDAFKTTKYYVGTASDKPFFETVLPEIAKNIKTNNKHSVTPYYDKFPLANNPENFQGLGHTTYANINGETVTAEAFYRLPNEGLHDPNYGLGILLYQCIQYKIAHPEEDVKITFSSYRTSASAAVCVIPDSKYYGYMRSLYTTNYDEQGFVRISYMLVEAARMGIEVTMVTQLNSYNKNQYNPATGKTKSRQVLTFNKYFTDSYSTKCYDKYEKGKKVSDFLNFVKVGWKVEDITSDMQHVKSLSASHYLATDGTEHKNAVFFSSANLDENDYRGANGNNGSQSGVIISDHEAIYRTTYNYMQLMARYSGQEELYELRDKIRRMNMEQYALIKAGKENQIPKDEQILYLGGPKDPVFELYFTPFGGGVDEWDPTYNPVCKYVDKFQQSDDYIEFIWNTYGYGNSEMGIKMSEKLADVYCSNPNPLNKYSVRATGFNSDEILKLKLGSEIGHRSVKSSSGVHSKDILLSYSENGVRHNVSMMTSINYYSAGYFYRTNSMLVIHEIDSDKPGFYEIYCDRFSYGAIKKTFEVTPEKLVLEVGQTYTPLTNNQTSDKLTWSSNKTAVATVSDGKITAKKAGSATITVSDGKTKDTIALTVVNCIDCYNADGITFNHNEHYMLSKKHSSMPLTFEATFSVEKDTLTGTTTFLGSDGLYDPSLVFSINKSGQPRVAIRDVADYSKQSVYTFKEVDVATGEDTHLAITMDFSKKAMYCYVNGELKQTIKSVAVPAKFTEKHNQVVGGDLRNGNATYFTGTIYSMAVWSDIRTAAEIASDYKNGITTSDTKLLAAYNFVKCPDHFVDDLSANNNDLKHISLWQNKSDVTAVKDYDYSFAVVGDTQTMCENDPDAMDNLYDWLIKNKDSQKIKYVIGLGDITDDSTDGEWKIAMNNFKKLDGKIPYVLVRGNHDDWDDFNRNLHNGVYEKTVEGMMKSGTIALTDPKQPGLIAQKQPDGSTIYVTRKGNKPEGGNVKGDLTNSYRTFSIQGTDYLILTLDFAPSDAALKWADSVITSHPEHKVIIATHAYMYRDGTTLSAEDCYPPTYYAGYTNPQNGDDMWEKCFSKHKNIVLVISGHDPWQHIVYRQDTGKNGNTVTQMLIDAQYVDKNIGSTAMVAMFYFSDGGKTLTVRYYSVEKDCYGSELSQFTIDLYDHTHEYTKTVTPATTSSNGKISKVCKLCGNAEFTTIPAAKSVKLSSHTLEYSGKTVTPTVKITDSKGKALKEGTDYTVAYAKKSIEVGSYSVKITFKGNYSDTKTLTYDIIHTHKFTNKVTPATLSANGKITTSCTVCGKSDVTTIYSPKTIKLSATSFEYNGKAQKPSVTVTDSKGKALKKGTDYTVTYSGKGIEAGTYSVKITFIGNYSGTKTLSYKIVHTHKFTTKVTPATLSANGKITTSCAVCGKSDVTTIYSPKTIKLSATSFEYNGKAQKPSVTVTDSKGKTLKKGTDYTVTYSGKGIEAGTYSVKITFKGNYSGTKTLSYIIKDKTDSKFILGDVDFDTFVTAADARLTLRAAVALEQLTALEKKAADVDRDNSVTAADARLILRATVGLEELK